MNTNAVSGNLLSYVPSETLTAWEDNHASLLNGYHLKEIAALHEAAAKNREALRKSRRRRGLWCMAVPLMIVAASTLISSIFDIPNPVSTIPGWIAPVVLLLGLLLIQIDLDMLGRKEKALSEKLERLEKIIGSFQSDLNRLVDNCSRILKHELTLAAMKSRVISQARDILSAKKAFLEVKEAPNSTVQEVHEACRAYLAFETRFTDTWAAYLEFDSKSASKADIFRAALWR